MTRILIVTCHGDKDEEGHLTEVGADQSLRLGWVLTSKGLIITRAAHSGLSRTRETTEDILYGAGVKGISVVPLPALFDDPRHHSQQFIDDRSVAHTTLREAALQEYLTLSEDTKTSMTDYGLIAAESLRDFLLKPEGVMDDVTLVVTHCVYANAMLLAHYQGKMDRDMENRLLTDPPLQPATGYIIREDGNGAVIGMETITWDMKLPRA